MSKVPSELADPALIFVYKADSGLFNTLADIGHKLFSPNTYACDLCKLTHGYFAERKAWKHFIESLPIPSEYLHRDQFRHCFPHLKPPLPAVYLRDGEQMKLCVTAASLRECNNLDELKNLILLACKSNSV